MGKAIGRGWRAASLAFCAAAGVAAPAASFAQDVTFVPARAEGYVDVAQWPDFTGVWNPDWAILFGRGGGRPPAEPVLTPQAQAELAAFQARQASEGVDQYLQVNCIPPGMPSIMRQPYPLEFLYSPGRVTIFTETYSQARRIYVDGRTLPQDPDPFFNGSSIGRWEGDVLIVETIGFNALVSYLAGVTHGEAMSIEERFWLEGPDLMRVETTITDPGVLAEPLVQHLAFRRESGWQIREYECNENNRLVDGANGANVDLGLDAEGDLFGPPVSD